MKKALSVFIVILFLCGCSKKSDDAINVTANVIINYGSGVYAWQVYANYTKSIPVSSNVVVSWNDGSKSFIDTLTMPANLVRIGGNTSFTGSQTSIATNIKVVTIIYSGTYNFRY